MEHLDFVALLLRMATGTLFFFQGYDKIYRIKIENVVRTFSAELKLNYISTGTLKSLVILSSWAELIGGLLLFFGVFKFYVLSALSLDLLFVAIAFSSMKAMWDMQYYFPRFIFICALWLIPFSADHFSIDQLLIK